MQGQSDEKRESKPRYLDAVRINTEALWSVLITSTHAKDDTAIGAVAPQFQADSSKPAHYSHQE